jgi:hypothetical protein
MTFYEKRTRFSALKGDKMITPETIDTGLIRRTMRAIPYEEAKTAVTRFFNETYPELRAK